MSRYLTPFCNKFEKLVDIVIGLYYEDDIETCCACGRSGHTTQCLDCVMSTTQCEMCFVEKHVHLPFHWPEVWNGGYFERKTYSDISGAIHLGHQESPCPSQSPSYSPSVISIAHVNGIHASAVHFCQCTQHPAYWEQLVAAQIVPATMENLQTAFTFAVLNLAHRLSLGSKCTMYNFATILSRLSNDAVSTNTSVCPFWSYLSYLSFTYICTYNRITQNTLSTHSGCREPFNMQNRVARHTRSTHLSLAEGCLIILCYTLLVHSLVWIPPQLMVTLIENGQWVLILCANKKNWEYMQVYTNGYPINWWQLPPTA